MAKKLNKRAKAMAAKREAKRQRFEARKDEHDRNSKYAERRRARNRGVPMSSRSGEGPPWWDRGPGLPLSVQMARDAAHAAKSDVAA